MLCLEVVLGVDKLVLDNKCFVPDPIQIKDQCLALREAGHMTRLLVSFTVWHAWAIVYQAMVLQAYESIVRQVMRDDSTVVWLMQFFWSSSCARSCRTCSRYPP